MNINALACFLLCINLFFVHLIFLGLKFLGVNIYWPWWQLWGGSCTRPRGWPPLPAQPEPRPPSPLSRGSFLLPDSEFIKFGRQWTRGMNYDGGGQIYCDVLSAVHRRRPSPLTGLKSLPLLKRDQFCPCLTTNFSIWTDQLNSNPRAMFFLFCRLN